MGIFKKILIGLGIIIAIIFVLALFSDKLTPTDAPENLQTMNGSNSFDFEIRPFILGTVPLPKSFFNEDDVKDAYSLTSEIGEYVSLSHQLGWDNNDKIKEYHNEVKFAKDNNLKLLISIDVLSDDRKEIGNLPKNLKSKDFSDQTLRKAYKDEVTKIADEFSPEYLFLGIELNGYYKNNPNDFDNFVSLYDETYDLIKSKHLNTKLSVTFFYEDLYHENQWEVINKFKEKFDVIAFTTYPSFYYEIDKIPRNYYSEIYKHTEKKPIIFTEVGWVGDNEKEQSDFLVNFLGYSEDLQIEGFFWTLLHDLDFGGPFKTMGLIDSNGKKKQVWFTMKELKGIPYDE